MQGEDIDDTKRTLFVGGFPSQVNEKILHAAFIPFGDITHIQIPTQALTEKHRGYGFIEYESQEDASEAIENMDQSELFGCVLKVNLTKPVKFTDSNRPSFKAKFFIY